MNYIMFSYEDTPTVVFIQDGSEMYQFSKDKEGDIFFKNWATSMREEGETVNLDSVRTGWTYYTSEDGVYEDNKDKIGKVIEGFGYDAP
jgi:hypothetical protein